MKLDKLINKNILKNSTLNILLGIIGFLILIVLYNYVYRNIINLAFKKKIINQKEKFQTTLDSITGYYYLKRYNKNKYFIYGTDTNSTTLELIEDNFDENDIYDYVFYINGNRKTGKIELFNYGKNKNVDIDNLEITVIDKNYKELKAIGHSRGGWGRDFYINKNIILPDNSENASRGLNFAYKDKQADDWSAAYFDTHATRQTNELKNFLTIDNNSSTNNIKDNTIVMVATKDEASNNYWADDDLRNRWKSIGSNQFANERDFGSRRYYRAGYAMIGIKKSYEKKSDDYGGITLAETQFRTLGDNDDFAKVVKAEIKNLGQYVLSKRNESNKTRTFYRSFVLKDISLKYHKIRDGFYSFNDRIYQVVAKKDTFEQYEVFEFDKEDRTYKLRGDGNTFTLVKHLGEFVKIKDNNKTISNFNDDNIDGDINNYINSYNLIYFINSNDKKFLFNSNNNNITSLKVDKSSNKETLISNANPEEKFIFIIRRKPNTPYHLIYCVNNYHVLKINKENETLLSEYYNDKKFSQHSYSEEYYFIIQPKPGMKDDLKYLIYQRSFRLDENDNNNVINTYYYLKKDKNNNVIIEKRRWGLLLEEITEDYLFQFDQFSTNNGHFAAKCAIDNNFIRKLDSGVKKYIHKNDTQNNQYQETQCKNLNIYNKFKDCLGDLDSNKNGCEDYIPTYIRQEESPDGTIRQRLITDSYDLEKNAKLSDGQDFLRIYNNVTIKECEDYCNANQDCYVFDFKKQLREQDKSIIDSKCKLVGASYNSEPDQNYDLYRIKVDTSGIRKPPVATIPQEEEITAERIAYRQLSCGDITNIDICNNTDGCYYRDGNCNNMCKFNEDGSCEDHTLNTSIGSLNDVDFDIISLYVTENTETPYLRLTIRNLRAKDPSKRLTMPVIRKEDGIQILFKCIDTSETEISNDIVVNYNVNYNSFITQDNLINDRDHFDLSIPSQCNESIDNYVITVTFKDIYGILKKFDVIGNNIYRDEDPVSLSEYNEISIDEDVVSETQTVQYDTSLLSGLF